MKRSARIRNRATDVPAVLDRLEEWLREAQVENGLIPDLRLLAEEVLVNIVEHGFPEPGEPWIALRVEIDEREIGLRIRDQGIPFDPLEHPLEERTGLSQESIPGGWGLRLIRALADQVQYRRDGGYNELLLIKRR